MFRDTGSRRRQVRCATRIWIDRKRHWLEHNLHGLRYPSSRFFSIQMIYLSAMSNATIVPIPRLTVRNDRQRNVIRVLRSEVDVIHSCESFFRPASKSLATIQNSTTRTVNLPVFLTHVSKDSRSLSIATRNFEDESTPLLKDNVRRPHLHIRGVNFPWQHW
jgi:hypothetical protein